MMSDTADPQPIPDQDKIMEQEQGIMTRFDKEAHSFVIRVWRENRANPAVPAEWRGWIRHVQSEQRHHFRDVAEISHIVAVYLHEDAAMNDVFEPIRKDVLTHDEDLT
jgi:hypothetical protein